MWPHLPSLSGRFQAGFSPDSVWIRASSARARARVLATRRRAGGRARANVACRRRVRTCACVYLSVRARAGEWKRGWGRSSWSRSGTGLNRARLGHLVILSSCRQLTLEGNPPGEVHPRGVCVCVPCRRCFLYNIMEYQNRSLAPVRGTSGVDDRPLQAMMKEKKALAKAVAKGLGQMVGGLRRAGCSRNH